MTPLARLPENEELAAAHLAIHLLWCATAPPERVLEPPRFRLEPGGSPLDVPAAAGRLTGGAVPRHLEGIWLDGAVRVHSGPAEQSGEDDGMSLHRIHRPEPATGRFITWFAGRGFLASCGVLDRLHSRFRLERAGFLALYTRDDLLHGLRELFGLTIAEIQACDGLLLAGGPPTGSGRPSAPIGPHPAHS